MRLAGDDPGVCDNDAATDLWDALGGATGIIRRYRPSARRSAIAVQLMSFQTMAPNSLIVSMPYCSVGFPVVSTAIR